LLKMGIIKINSTSFLCCFYYMKKEGETKIIVINYMIMERILSILTY